MRILVIVLLLVLLSGCQSKATKSTSPAGLPTPTPNQLLTANDVLKAFKDANLPIKDDVVFSDETDPNKLLGRPHQYTGKASWNDPRTDKQSAEDKKMTVEVFASLEDLENRRRYVERVTSVMSPLVEYHYVHKNALLRLNHRLLPRDAAEYERILKSL